MVVFKLDDKQIIWGNQVFFEICGVKRPSFESRMTDLVPDFSDKWLKEGKSQFPGTLTVGDRKYQIHGNIVTAPKRARPASWASPTGSTSRTMTTSG